MSPAFPSVPRRRAVVYTILGAAVGIGVGAAVARWAVRRQYRCAPRRFTEEEKRAHELLVRLAEATGNASLSPADRCLEDVIREVQLTLDVPRTDGVWDAATEQAVVSFLQRQQNPLSSRPFDPAQELEPDENWELAYERSFGDAFEGCCQHPGVIAFDQAVVFLLEQIFPDAGSFALRPGTGAWKRAARDRATQDLASALGPTELQARARLCRFAGVAAMAEGADLGQASRCVAEHAWPTATWESPERQPWQEAFMQAAAGALQS